MIVEVKKGMTHTRADHVSRITNGEAPIGVNDKLPYATLFRVQMVSKQSEHFINFLTTVVVKALDNARIKQVDFIIACSQFQLVYGKLYYLCDDKVMRLVACLEVYHIILAFAHVLTSGYHRNKKLTIQSVLWEGYQWPTLHEDARDITENFNKIKDSIQVSY